MVKSWTELYLSPPSTKNIRDYPSEVAEKLRKLKKKDIDKLGDTKKGFKEMMAKYGRFWLDDNDKLMYHTTEGKEVYVKQLNINTLEHKKSVVGEMNGEMISPVSLKQLTILLKKYRPKYYEDTLKCLKAHKHIINHAVSRATF